MPTYYSEFQRWCKKYGYDCDEHDFVGWMNHYFPHVAHDWTVKFPINYPEPTATATEGGSHD